MILFFSISEMGDLLRCDLRLQEVVPKKKHLRKVSATTMVPMDLNIGETTDDGRRWVFSLSLRLIR